MAREWVNCTLGNVLTLQRGFDLPIQDRKLGPYPIIASTGEVGFHDEAMVKAPGVVIGRSGSLGGGQYVTRDFWPLNTTLWVKDFKGNIPRYCYYLLKSIDFSKFNVGGAVPTLNRNHIHPLPVHVPRDVNEQCAISHILGTFDDKIELNRRMNETLEAIARAMFKSWFVDFDPVRAKMNGEPPDSICQRLGLTPDLLALFSDRFVDSELGEIPEGWRISKLTIEAERHGGFIQTGPFGSQLHAADYVAEGVPVVMPQDLVNRRVSLVRIVRVTHEMTKRLSRHMLKPGDVVYSRRGDVERHALISERESDWLCGTGCLLVRLGDTWPSQAYLSEVLDLPVTRAWLVRHAVGATMPNLNTSILGAMPLLLAPESLLLAFEKIAGPLRKQQIAVNMESDSLALVRDALSPKLLSGELRMPVSEIAIEAMA